MQTRHNEDPVGPPPNITPQFDLGQVVATPAVLDTLTEHGVTPISLLSRHVGGDFGDIDPEDWQLRARLKPWRISSKTRLLVATASSPFLSLWDLNPHYDVRDLETDADRVLNPVWRDAFLAFMNLSHLPPERLLVWAQAALQAYPANPMEVDRRYPVSVEELARWASKMRTCRKSTEHYEWAAKMEETKAFACFISTVPIIWNHEDGDYTLGSLIVAFERMSETLVHHIVRHTVTAGDVMHVAQKLVENASKKLASDRFEVPRYLLLPDIGWNKDCYKELRQLFRMNLQEKKHPTQTLCLPSGFTLIERSRVLEISLQGRPFRTRHDLWLPFDYTVRHPPEEINCSNEHGCNAVHDLLAKASRTMRRLMKKLVGTGACPPTWHGLSRSR